MICTWWTSFTKFFKISWSLYLRPSSMTFNLYNLWCASCHFNLMLLISIHGLQLYFLAAHYQVFLWVIYIFHLIPTLDTGFEMPNIAYIHTFPHAMILYLHNSQHIPSIIPPQTPVSLSTKNMSDLFWCNKKIAALWSAMWTYCWITIFDKPLVTLPCARQWSGLIDLHIFANAILAYNTTILKLACQNKISGF